jgi:hypothetical protein
LTARFLESTQQKTHPTNQIETAKGIAKRDIILFRLAIYPPQKITHLFNGLSFLRTVLLCFVNLTSHKNKQEKCLVIGLFSPVTKVFWELKKAYISKGVAIKMSWDLCF